MNGEIIKYTYPPTGDIITFCRTVDGSIYSKVDNSFARANGYTDLFDMQNQVYKDGGPDLPEWMLWESGLCANINQN